MEDSTREMSNTNRYLPYVFVAVQFVCADLLLKLRHEEKLLAAEVDGYSGFMQRTKKVLPFVY